MIDVRKLKYDGRQLNHQDGLVFYFTEQGHVVNFLIDIIGDRKCKVRVTMQPDINHARPHVHINEHGASFAIDTGQLLAGDCDGKTQGLIRNWIGRHREDLLELWDIAKRGGNYQPVVERIQRARSFEDFGFQGKEPQHKTVIGKVIVWHNDEIVKERNADGSITVIGVGDMYVGLPNNYQEGSMHFETLQGEVKMKRWPA